MINNNGSYHIYYYENLGYGTAIYPHDDISYYIKANPGQIMKFDKVYLINNDIFNTNCKQLVKIYAKMIKVGNTSATFNVEARAYNVFRGDESVLLATNMTFVRVDEEGIPIPISEQVKRVFNTPPSKL